MLTLKQCQNLREWGLPQNKSRSYYRDDGKLFYNNEVGLIWADEEDQFACPDLEQLLEFADKKVKKINKHAWIQIETPVTKFGFLATVYPSSVVKDAKSQSALNSDPKQAIYKLLEQIIEPNNKVDDSGATEDPLANTVKLSELEATDEKENDD